MYGGAVGRPSSTSSTQAVTSSNPLQLRHHSLRGEVIGSDGSVTSWGSTPNPSFHRSVTDVVENECGRAMPTSCRIQHQQQMSTSGSIGGQAMSSYNGLYTNQQQQHHQLPASSSSSSSSYYNSLSTLPSQSNFSCMSGSRSGRAAAADHLAVQLGVGQVQIGNAGPNRFAQQSAAFVGAQPQPAHCGSGRSVGLRHCSASAGPLPVGSAGTPPQQTTSWNDDRPTAATDKFWTMRNACTNEMTSSPSAQGGAAVGVVKEELSDPSDCSSSDAYSDQDWTSTSSGKPGSSTSCYGSAGSFIDSPAHRTGLDGNVGEATRRRQGGSSRRSRLDRLTPEEDERRRVRRERNKLAAARCRQRRVDLTNQLLAETESLEDERLRLEKEISNLQRQRNQLEFVLEAHVPRCHIFGMGGPAIGTQPPAAHVQHAPIPSIYTSLPQQPVPVVKVETADVVSMVSEPSSRSATRPNECISSSGRDRPASLSIKQSHGPVVTVTSSGSGATPIVFDSIGLDCMIDGHTGLTPITGAPSFGGQRVTPDDVTLNEMSPSTLLTL